MRSLALLPALALLFAAGAARADDPPPPPPNVIIEEQPAPSVTPPTEEPAPVPEPPPHAAALPATKKREVPVGIKLDGGYAVRTLEQLPVHGADIGLALGAQPTRHFALFGEARLFIGSTSDGLDVKSGRFACEMDVVFDRFRFTFDPGFFIVGVGRATLDQTIVTGGPDVGLALRGDVVRDDTYAIFARVGVDAGITFADGTVYAGATFGVGIDFDFVRGDRSSL